MPVVILPAVAVDPGSGRPAPAAGDGDYSEPGRLGATMLALAAGGGAGGPEASDEALNTVVNALVVGARPQNIDFTPDWRGAGVVKIAILVTDAPPGGFDDSRTNSVMEWSMTAVFLSFSTPC